MLIKSAEFTTSSAEVTQLPKPIIPEYAFIGRSNVGKSSLINMLTNKRKLAKTSGTPGKTRLINHFIINKEWYLVDLPGYGYAKVSKTERKKWHKLISDYILLRPNLLNVFVLVDIRHEPQTNDTEFMEWLALSGIPFVIVFTKSDKLTKNKIDDHVAAYQEHLKESWEELPKHIITSATDQNGKDEVLGYVEEVNKVFKTSAAPPDTSARGK